MSEIDDDIRWQYLEDDTLPPRKVLGPVGETSIPRERIREAVLKTMLNRKDKEMSIKSTLETLSSKELVKLVIHLDSILQSCNGLYDEKSLEKIIKNDFKQKKKK